MATDTQSSPSASAAPAVICPRCGAKQLAPQLDRTTGKPASADGKLILRCSACNEVRIVPEAGWDAVRGRSSLRAYFRIALDALGAFGSLALAIANWLTGFWVPWQITVAFAVGFGLLGAGEVVIQRGLLLRRYGLNNPRLEENLGALLLVLLVIGWVAFTIVLGKHYDPRMR